MRHLALARRSPVMPTTESFRLANASVAAATASLATTSAAARSAAMESTWAAPLPRTYFVGGFRVEHQRDTQGHSTWTCDCVDFAQSRRMGSESGCQHTRRIAAAAELDQLLRTPGLVLPTGCY
jgi:hypothetical protein